MNYNVISIMHTLRFLFNTSLIIFLSSCGNAFKESNNGQINNELEETTNITEFYNGHALLGPLAGANVDVFQWPDFNMPVHSTVTEENVSLTF